MHTETSDRPGIQFLHIHLNTHKKVQVLETFFASLPMITEVYNFSSRLLDCSNFVFMSRFKKGQIGLGCLQGSKYTKTGLLILNFRFFGSLVYDPLVKKWFQNVKRIADGLFGTLHTV